MENVMLLLEWLIIICYFGFGLVISIHTASNSSVEASSFAKVIMIILWPLISIFFIFGKK